jgi:hypothetical protein
MSELPFAGAAVHVCRMTAVLDRVLAAFPDLQVGPLETEGLDFVCAVVTLPDGTHLLLSVDPDVPEVLYKVLRLLRLRARARKHPFETRQTPASACTDKLSTDAVVHLVSDYVLAHSGVDAAGGTI